MDVLHKKTSECSVIQVKQATRARRILSAAASIVYPDRCHLCHTFNIERHQTFCQNCWRFIHLDRNVDACPTCAENASLELLRDGACISCRRRRPPIARIIRGGIYGHAMGPLVVRFKYHADMTVGQQMGLWMANALRHAPPVPRKPNPLDADLMVPVPTTLWRKLRAPIQAPIVLSRLVARELSRNHLIHMTTHKASLGPSNSNARHKPIIPIAHVLRRIRGGPHQVGLSIQQREENVRDAFDLTYGTRIDGVRILLIDDVATTCATIYECGRVLKRAGAAWVCAAVIARAGHTMETLFDI